MTRGRRSLAKSSFASSGFLQAAKMTFSWSIDIPEKAGKRDLKVAKMISCCLTGSLVDEEEGGRGVTVGDAVSSTESRKFCESSTHASEEAIVSHGG
jgi:hypothetical protein